MHLKAYELLEQPVEVLGLSATALEVLEEVGVTDVSTLLDQDWAAYPTAVADEIHRVALAKGLIEETVDQPPIFTPEELAEREWQRIAFDEEERVRISHTDPEMPPDLKLVSASAGYTELDDVWVEHWTPGDSYDSDFRPWFDLLTKSPPAKLRVLEVGTYGGGSAYAKLGPVAPMVAALPALRTLFLSGVMDTVEPFENERLEHFQVETGQWSRAALKRFVAGTTFRELKTFVATSELSDAAPLAKLMTLPALGIIELSVFKLSAEFFGALHEATNVTQLNLGNCRWPVDDTAIAAAVLGAAPYLQNTALFLPTDAQDADEQFRGAGLSCEYGA